MEHKDKYRVHAHTFIPSVERLEDNRSLIQLASKAKDVGSALSNVNDNELKVSADKKPLAKSADWNLKNQKSTHGIVSDKITKVGKGVEISKPALEISSSAYCTQKPLEMNHRRDMDFAGPIMGKFTSKSSTRISDYKTFTPALSSSVATSQSSVYHTSSKSQTKGTGRSMTDKHPKEDSDKMRSASFDKDDVKENAASTHSSYYRTFMSQSDRPPPMKLERNRGNHKLPVGIAVARQRTHTTPNKSSTTSTRSASPDLERNHLEHVLNREREVFLRENKEISNFTSMLQANAASSAISLLNMQGNGILQGSFPIDWEQERLLMSSLLQWQAQQQSALISNGLQSPPMWLGGTSPYRLPGNQHAASLGSPHNSHTRYPYIGNGLGGLVFMPQFLQDAGPAATWSSLAALCGNVPAPLPNSYTNLLSHQLGNLPSHELQPVLQQAMMSHEVPFPTSKANLLKLDERDTNMSSMRHHSPMHDKVCSPTIFRASTSPEAIHQERTMSCCSADRSSFLRSVVSPPLQTPCNRQQQGVTVTTQELKSKIPSSCHAKLDSSTNKSTNKSSNLRDMNKRNRTDENRTEAVRETTTHSPMILDLTSSSPENNMCMSLHEADITVNVCETSDQEHYQSNLNGTESSNFVKPDAVQTKSTNGDFVSKTNNPFVHSGETAPSDLWDKTENVSVVVNHSFKNNPELLLSSGVELLTKAADIHMKTLKSKLNLNRKRKLSDASSDCVVDKKKLAFGNVDVTADCVTTQHCQDIQKSAIDPIDVSSFDPDVLAAVRGITLLSQSCRNSANMQKVLNSNIDQKPNQVTVPSDERSPSSPNDCNSDKQSTVSYESLNDVAIISGDCLSSSELKDADNSGKRPLKRRLKKPFSSKKFSREGDNVKVDNFKLDHTMEAREVDMKMRLADLQRRYREKQRELAKIQRRNKKEKVDNSSPTTISTTSDFLSAGQHISTTSPKYKFGEITALATSQVCPQSSSLAKKVTKPGPCASSDPYRQKSLFERFASEVCALEKANEIGCSLKDGTESEVNLDQHQAPSGSRKRKLDKPKRICLSPGKTPTVPLVDSAKKSFSTHTSFTGLSKDETSKEKKSRKMKKATKNMKLKSVEDADNNSWVFKSKNKSEKQSDVKQKKVKARKLSTKSQKSSGNIISKRDKSPSVSESRKNERCPEPSGSESKNSSSPRLELKEEDLVKGLQILVPLEDKLLYKCHINPIQPPDIYEVTVEGERHRHRPIVMCLEQILTEAVPDVKPKSASDVHEGSRVAAYWSHQLHYLYTGTIAFNESDDEEEENRDEGMIQVEFDDGDSSMIPLEDIRLLPRNYPIMQPDAPFILNFVHRKRKTSDMLKKETPKTSQSRTKKVKSEKKGKVIEKSHNKKAQKCDPDHGDPSEEGSVDNLNNAIKKKRTSTRKRSKLPCSETASSSASSADEDSDIMFSDSDDTYDGDGDIHTASDRKRILHDYNEDSQTENPKLELWSWLNKEVQKKSIKGKAKKICHKSIKRGDETISCGDSAVFLSAGRMHLPYIGRIESMWESWGDNMVVKVRWFYHPEETKRGRTKSHDKHPLYKSSHIDENDVQTISHKCEVVSYKEYCRRMRNNEKNVFYCAGTYDPATGQVTHEHTDKRKHSKS